MALGRSPPPILPSARAPTVVVVAAAVAVYPQHYFWNSIPGICGCASSWVEVGEQLFSFHHYLTDNLLFIPYSFIIKSNVIN